MSTEMANVSGSPDHWAQAAAAVRGVVDGWSVAPNGQPGALLHACLEAAVLAPSVYNSQPWRFRATPTGIDVLADPKRRLAVVDPRGRELYISLGAAIFNLRTSMLAHGRQPILALLPDGPQGDRVAQVTVGPFTHPTPTSQILAEAIPRRRTNRRPFADIAVMPHVLADLEQAALAEDASLAIADEPGRVALLSIVRTAELRRRRDPQYWLELAAWTLRRGRSDGVPPEAFGPWSAAESLPLRDFGLVQTPPHRRVERFEPTPTIAVLSTAADGPEAWLRAGQALERVLLTATVRGLCTTPMSQPLEIEGLRALLSNEETGRTVQAIVRLGYGPACPASPRRPVEEVLERS
jgi:nitroreductase